MISKQRIVTASATFVLVGSVGYVMQNSDALAARFSPNQPIETSSQVQATEVLSAGQIPVLPLDAIVPDGFTTERITTDELLVASNTSFGGEFLSELAAPAFFARDCKVSLSVLPAAGAMVSLQLAAPCYQNQRIEIDHGGLEFADNTNLDGNYEIMMPALYEYEAFSVTFMDGRNVEAKTLMLSVDSFDRAIFKWDGPQSLHIHAFEQSAEFGEAGHVWAQAPGSIGDRVEAIGGHLVELGNPDILHPMLAEVYSFPTKQGGETANIEIMLEAEIDDVSCGTELAGTAIQISPAGVVNSDEVSLNIPACGGENGYLVLNNLFQDLNIALN